MDSPITASVITAFGSIAAGRDSIEDAETYAMGAAAGAAPLPVQAVVTIDGDALPIGCRPRDLGATIQLVNFIHRKDRPNQSAA